MAVSQKKFFLFFLIGIFFFSFLTIQQLALGISQSDGFQPVKSNLEVTALASSDDNSSVEVGIWLGNIFDYQYTRGDYTLDMFVYFFWSNPNISTIDWHFANGYPITPSSITLVENGTVDAIRHEVYRATAHLSTPPDASNFPFDNINLTVSIEVLTHGNNLMLSWLKDQTGMDSRFNNPGWKTIGIELNTSIQHYPLGVQVPNAAMTITQQRQRASTSFTPFVAPAIFALVCAVSFLFSLKEMGPVGLRIGLNTSMLVTTLLFSFGVSSNIPPASQIVLYSVFLLSILIFMVCNLIVTIIGVVGWFKYKNETRTKMANQLGFLVSLAVPIIVFIVLFFLR